MKGGSTSLPHFPYAYSLDVAKQVLFILSRLSAAFPCSPPQSRAASPPLEARTTHVIRKRLNDINQDIRARILQSSTLQHALNKTKFVYESLKDEQAALLKEIDKRASLEHRIPMLPVEVVETICSFSCGGHPPSALKSFGVIAYKSTPISCSFRGIQDDLTQLAIKNGARLNVSGFGVHGYPDVSAVEEAIRIMSRWPLGIWRKLKFVIPIGELGPKLCTALLQHCTRSLASVQSLAIDNETSWTLSLVDILGVEEFCREMILKLPACTELRVPLGLLQIFRSLVPRVVHLEVRLADTRVSMATFHDLGFTALQSLEISIDGAEPDWDEVDGDNKEPINPIHLPSLNKLKISVREEASVDLFSSILGWFRCEQLQWLDVACGIELPISLESYDSVIDEWLIDIQSRFEFLERLSIHMPRDSRPFTYIALERLQETEERLQVEVPDKVVLPNLKHLSVSVDLGDFDQVIPELVCLLQNRRNFGARLETVTIQVDKRSMLPVHKLLIEYLGLFVPHVRVLPGDG